jgi:ABC-type multidrug transport system fused ATPase/permease subunit
MLDEATSHLDVERERAVNEALRVRSTSFERTSLLGRQTT